jgi:hypothetical protein
MDGIQYLKRGEHIRLVGDVPASVEENPCDGVWLLARYSQPIGDLTNGMDRRLSEGVRNSEHGMTVLRDAGSLDALIVVHAEDILGLELG